MCERPRAGERRRRSTNRIGGALDDTARAKRASSDELVRKLVVRALVLTALEANGCAFAGPIRDGLELSLSRALDAIEGAT